MLPFQLAAVLVLLAVCSFAPGFFLMRRVHWTAMEKLCGSVALSLMLLWLAGWGLYAAGAPPSSAYGISAVCAVLGIVSFGDARRLLAVPRVKHALYGFGFLLGWTLLSVCIIRVYTGASWSGDWLEHFQRTLFFAQRFPKDTPVFGGYLVPARPPAQNLLASLFLSQAGDSFEIFQTAFVFLNLLFFLPCCLALPMLARSRKFGVTPLVALLAASPVVMQNATYTWTKLLTAFFVILAILLYVRGWRRNDSGRIVFAFLCLAMGMLVHYSAGPYIVCLTLHYLVVVLPKRPHKARELALIAVSCGLLLATWFGWSIAAYGAKTTVASNTSVTASQSYPGSNLEKIAGNIVDSLIPHALRDSELVKFFDQPNPTGSLRDNIFITYEVQLIFTMGVIGGPLVLWLLLRGLRRRDTPAPVRVFWWWLIGASVALGLAVVGERDRFGSAHLTLLPMTVLALTLLAARFRQNRVIAMLLIAGCVIDFSLGVFLHFRVEHLENTPAHTYYTSPSVMNGQVVLAPTPDTLSASARENWFRKHEQANVKRWRVDLQAAAPAARAQAMGLLDSMASDDPTLFRGWYARHGGEITFLGDHFGTSDIPSGLLLIAFAGLLWSVWRMVPATVAAAPVRAVESKSVRPRKKR